MKGSERAGQSGPPKLTLAERALTWLAESIFRHKWWYIWPNVVLLPLSIWYTIAYLNFSTDRNDLVGSDKKYHHNYLEFRKEFPGQDDLVAVVESDQAEKNRQFVERLGAKLEAETNLFTDVFYKGDLKMMGPKALLFVPENTLGELQATLKAYRPFIDSFSQTTNLNSLLRKINQQFRTASRETNAANDSLVKSIPALQRIVDQAADSLTRPGLPPSPGINALFGAGEEAEREQYITFADGHIYLVTARAREAKVNEDAVHRLRELIRQTQIEVPGINVGMTGEPVLEFDEMKQSQYDTTVATIVSLVLVALMFIYGYHETGRPIKATICLIVGLGYTMAFTTYFIGHLNILTITFIPMLIGMAIDFGVHLISRYEEELRHGANRRTALNKAIVNTGQGIFTGCMTTAFAFIAMAGTDFRGIQEMGIISGAGLIICLVPMMTLLPALLLRGTQNVIDHQLAPVRDTRAMIENVWLARPRTTIAVGLVLCGIAAFAARRIVFDYNLLHMQSEGLPAVVFEQKLINSASKSVLFGAVMTKDLEEALAMEAKLTNLASVAEVQSMAKYLTEDSSRKLAMIGEIKASLASIQFADVDRDPVKLKDLKLTLEILRSYLGLASEEVQKEGDKELLAQLQGLRNAISGLLQRISTADSLVAAQTLGRFQQALMDDIRGTFAALRTQDNRAGLRAEDLPEPLRNRFIGRTGKHLLQVYPREDVWERPQQERFVAELRTVAPDVTGTPVQLLEYTTLLKESYQEAAFYSLIAIVLLVLLHFRSALCVVLALVPVAVGVLWMLWFMAWQKIPFNPANVMTLPLVIGVGVTSGIHILNRFSEERNPGILAKSTGKAVLISALTTVAGFGSLILAEHRGIQSLGYVMAVGTATCMIAALTFLPAVLNLLSRRGWSPNKKPSAGNAQPALGPEEPRHEPQSNPEDRSARV